MVERLDGVTEEVSLRNLFAHAHEFRTVSGEMPIMYISVLRLLLAVLYCTYGAVVSIGEILTSEILIKEWRHMYERGSFDMDAIGSYLDEVHEGFDLFGDRPFYQTAGLAYVAKNFDPASELIMDMPKPDKFLFSMRSNRDKVELSFSEATRCLLLNHGYDISGTKSPVIGNTNVKQGKAYPPGGVVGTGWCGAIGGIFLEGENLFETIMLNWVLVSGDNVLLGKSGDLAPWEREDAGSDAVVREPSGPVDLLTWQSRRTRLILNEQGTAVVGMISCYGDSTRAADKNDCEIMTSWRASVTQQKKLETVHVPLMPIRPDSSRALWRGLSSLLQVNASNGGEQSDLRAGVIKWADRLNNVLGWFPAVHRFVRVRAQGVSYGTRDCFVSDVVDDFIDLNRSMLRADSKTIGLSIDMVSRAEKAVQALVQLASNVQLANGADEPSIDIDIRERAYDELDGIFRRRLAFFGPDEDSVSYCNAWRDEIRTTIERIARGVVSSGGLSAFRESDSMTAGRAISIFKTRLAAALAHVGGHDVPSADEAIRGREE